MTTQTVSDGDDTVTITTSDDGQHVSIATPPTPVTPATPPTPPTPGGHAAYTGDFTVGGHRGMLHLGPGGAYVHSRRPLDPGSFFAGLMLGALLYFIVQTALRWHARREVRSVARAAAIGPQTDDGMAAAVAALARRTATLETIVTDPAHRTAREIDALR